MILCVDPDADRRATTTETLESAGFDTVEAPSIAAARDYIDGEGSVDCLVTEHDLPDGIGLQLVELVRSESPDTSCLVYTDVPLADIHTPPFADVIAEYVRRSAAGAEAELVAFAEDAVTRGSQRAYPLPENEAARLAALSEYADDPSALDETFGRLTELAAATFDVDAAAIGLVGDHVQEFLGCYGVSLGSIDREDTICTHAILDDGATVIEDVRTDPRYEDNEGLAVADIRFYASAPLRTPSGEPIGTFCLYDDEPGSLSDRERELLVLFAADAMEHLELRRRLREVPDGD